MLRRLAPSTWTKGTTRKGGWYGWKPSSSSNCSIRAFRAYYLIEVRQTIICRAIRADSISINSTISPSHLSVTRLRATCCRTGPTAFGLNAEMWLWCGCQTNMRGWRNTVGRLIEFVWPKKACCRPWFTGTCVKTRGVRFHRIRDSKQYYFNSIPPTSRNMCVFGRLTQPSESVSSQDTNLEMLRWNCWCSKTIGSANLKSTKLALDTDRAGFSLSEKAQVGSGSLWLEMSWWLMYGFSYHFNNLRFKRNTKHHWLFSCTCSFKWNLKCRLLKWFLDHPVSI